MKTLLYRLLPGVVATLLIIVLGAVLSSRSRAEDPRPSSAPLPPEVSAAPAGERYASAPSRDYSRCDSRPCRHQVERSAYACSSCGAPIDNAGRYAAQPFDGAQGRRDYNDGPAPQVVYVVHVNGGDAQDLRAWPQSIYPLSTRWAMPIPQRTACRY